MHEFYNKFNINILVLTLFSFSFINSNSLWFLTDKMLYTPSETKPSKNLFNKVIYFFMRPTIGYETEEADDDTGTVIIENKNTQIKRF